ncbi:MAG TPA: hypothetical protein VFT82_04610 [Candidatus Paceibacterota bacterium]|nr:hypothetical protein [Candidatus Paceibacterota bacterium]
MNKVFFIIGACGSGKTLAIENIQKRLPKAFNYCFYDTLGAPTDEEVYREYGNWDAWHMHLTDAWIRRIKQRLIMKNHTVIDCQARPDVIERLCDAYGIDSYEIILLDCSLGERKRRLYERAVPHIVNPSLEPWTRYLHDECEKRGYMIIDNSDIPPEETRDKLIEHMRQSIGHPKTKLVRAKVTG